METVLDAVCASCGTRRLPDGHFCLSCGSSLTDPSSALADKSHSNRVPDTADKIEYAGFWLRFLAGAVDVVLEALGALLITLALDFVLQRFGRGLGIDRWNAKVFAGFAYIAILAVGSWLYCAFMESSSWRATVGKRLLGLQVMDLEGRRISFGQATVRHFMKFLSLFCLMIGFLMAGWTKRRQALHDIPTDCLVIRLPAKNASLPAN
ncbi:MAG: RDD family protein [Candidatus Korobacteraceae bacterium]